jgi:hypothetical protein
LSKELLDTRIVLSSAKIAAALSINIANQRLHQPLMLKNTRIAFTAIVKIAFSEITLRSLPATEKTEGSVFTLLGLTSASAY